MADVAVRFRTTWRLFEEGEVYQIPPDTAQVLCLPAVGIAERVEAVVAGPVVHKIPPPDIQRRKKHRRR